MRILIIDSVYASSLRRSPFADSSFGEQPYDDQMAAFAEHLLIWSKPWKEALAESGYETKIVLANVPSLQQTWAEAHGMTASQADSGAVVVAQARDFEPDIVWFNWQDPHLFSVEGIQALRRDCPSVRGIIASTGSAITKSDGWKAVDLVLAHAPEAQEWFSQLGRPCRQIPHGFDPRILDAVDGTHNRHALVFIGQLLTHSDYHLQRIGLLRSLSTHLPLTIYSHAAEVSWRERVETRLKGILYLGAQASRHAGLPDGILRRLPLLGRAATWPHAPLAQTPRASLHGSLQPAVYGREMFQTLADAKIVLNIHADSSPTHASNMRLYEVTGCGACLLTDWRENLPDLFELDKEIIAYRSPEECLEKAKWLLEHPAECQAIAAAGQQRTLRDYTVAERVSLLVGELANAFA